MSDTASPAIPRRLAIQESLLDADTEAGRVMQAAAVGAAGIEYHAEGLKVRVPEVSAALNDSPVTAASVRLPSTYAFLSPDEPTRQHALDALRHAMTDAVDIGAGGVVLVPQPGSLDLPDLMPYKAPVQLGVELMVMHLRSLADLAYVFEINLYLLPVNRYDAAFMNLLDEGVELRRRIKFHKHILLAADTYHMAHTESDPVAALRKARNSVGYLYLAENNGGLPGSGRVDFGALRGALGERTTWAVVTRHDTPQPPGQHALQDAVAYLHGAGY